MLIRWILYVVEDSAFSRNRHFTQFIIKVGKNISSIERKLINFVGWSMTLLDFMCGINTVTMSQFIKIHRNFTLNWLECTVRVLYPLLPMYFSLFNVNEIYLKIKLK